jgi:hypothetical protein
MSGSASCSKADCTIAATGKCLEAHPDPQECPFFATTSAEPEPAVALVTPIEPDQPDEPTPSAGRVFHAGMELGFEDAISLSRAKYVHLVPVLGATDAGKTCVLVSLYLLAVNRMLARFRFAGSQTLLGFEHRARGLRKWPSGELPDQFVDHTILGEDRVPSFVHLAFDDLSRKTHRREFLFTDLPGEWTTDLINRLETAKRFSFLARADAVVVAIDGKRLADPETRQQEVMQAEHLIQRLKQTGMPVHCKAILVISKRDESEISLLPYVESIRNLASELGFALNAIETAAISRDPNRIPNGLGIEELLQTIVAAPESVAQQSRGDKSGRAMSRFTKSGRSK